MGEEDSLIAGTKPRAIDEDTSIDESRRNVKGHTSCGPDHSARCYLSTAGKTPVESYSESSQRASANNTETF